MADRALIIPVILLLAASVRDIWTLARPAHRNGGDEPLVIARTIFWEGPLVLAQGATALWLMTRIH